MVALHKVENGLDVGGCGDSLTGITVTVMADLGVGVGSVGCILLNMGSVNRRGVAGMLHGMTGSRALDVGQVM